MKFLQILTVVRICRCRIYYIFKIPKDFYNVCRHLLYLARYNYHKSRGEARMKDIFKAVVIDLPFFRMFPEVENKEFYKK